MNKIEYYDNSMMWKGLMIDNMEDYKYILVNVWEDNVVR